MLSRAQIKYIQSLQVNKFRHSHGVYIAEGEKTVHELLMSNSPIDAIYATATWVTSNAMILNARHPDFDIVSDDELKKISTLTTPNQVLALAKIPDTTIPAKLEPGIYIALDNIQDPGNLGTIIRTADWFGLSGVICSDNTVDAFNPKVVQATMGSLLHLPVWYGDLIKTFATNNHLQVMAAVLAGNNIYETQLPKEGIILIGNEGKGVSDELIKMATLKLTIPKFGHAESLNASVAAGVLMGLIRS